MTVRGALAYVVACSAAIGCWLAWSSLGLGRPGELLGALLGGVVFVALARHWSS